MKIKNIFKKKAKVVAETNIQSLDKKQLEKVIGGAETLGGFIPGGGIVSAKSEPRQTQGTTFGE